MDIIGACSNNIGFLAENEDDYAEYVKTAINGFDSHKRLRENAREWVRDRFSKQSFNKLFIE